MVLHNYITHQRARTAQARRIQARYRRKAALARRLSDPDTVMAVVGMGFVGGVCLACLIGFLMPI